MTSLPTTLREVVSKGGKITRPLSETAERTGSYVNPNTWEAKAGALARIPGQSGYIVRCFLITNKQKQKKPENSKDVWSCSTFLTGNYVQGLDNPTC